ncbi:ThiF family adenylyltransferase [Komagataeibacter oboediens]|nr:ThiF family adenylyltransferase [Komagataeibacter oboediens]
MLDPDFPYSLPRFALVERGDLLKAPHVEGSGKLCLSGDGSRVNTLDPVAVIAYSYKEALSLIDGDEAGDNREDFTVDFEAYWRRDATDSFQLRTWLNPERRSRPVWAWHGKNYYLLAESQDDISRWLTNRHGSDTNRKFNEAAFIWLDKLPEPEAFPDNAVALRHLVQVSPEGLKVFDWLMTKMANRAAVILAGPAVDGGISLAGLIIENPDLAGTGKAPRVSISKGFRPGKVPSYLLAFRRSARRVIVERVDACLGRMRAGEGLELAAKRVAIIGCGSLGSGVAKLMLQSGVGSLTLIDPDYLDWVNLGRHELGADDVGRNKATALANRFRTAYPHVRELSAEPVSWQDVLRRNPEALRNFDLVLSLMGDWNAESALNDLQRSGTGELTATIVYGWLEDQAGAAHALAIGQDGACFRCGFGPTGTIHTSATAWPRRGPIGCGGPTSIYGAVDLVPAQAMVTSLAIDLLLARATPPVHRTWLAPSATLTQSGGHWNPRWIEKFGDPLQGGFLLATPWSEESTCPCNHASVTLVAPALMAPPTS